MVFVIDLKLKEVFMTSTNESQRTTVSKIELSGPNVIGAENDTQKSDAMLQKLQEAQSPNQKDAVINEIITSDNERAMVNGIAKVAEYPNGVARLVEAVILKQQKDGNVGALVWMVENSRVVQGIPRLKYAVVRALIESRNEKALNKIANSPAVTEVPLLQKAVASRDVSPIIAAQARFEASRRNNS